jgi:hypothetical protein
MEKFKLEEKFLELLVDKTGELYSTIQLSDTHGLTPTDLQNRPKFSPYFLDGKEDISGGISYLSSIFLFDDDTYIYLSKSDPMISSFSWKRC